MNNSEQEKTVFKTNFYGFEANSDALFVAIGLLVLCLFLFGGLF